MWKREGEGLNGRLVQVTVKFGGSLMFWGCMFWEGVGYGTNIDERMDADLFVSIFFSFLYILAPKGPIYIPVHAGSLVTKYKSN